MTEGWAGSHSLGTLRPSQRSVTGRQPFTKQQEGSLVIQENGNSEKMLILSRLGGFSLKGAEALPAGLKGQCQAEIYQILLGASTHSSYAFPDGDPHSRVLRFLECHWLGHSG